jgi:hypothetical protein
VLQGQEGAFVWTAHVGVGFIAVTLWSRRPERIGDPNRLDTSIPTAQPLLRDYPVVYVEASELLGILDNTRSKLLVEQAVLVP